jgi:hypothetical protein
LRRPDERRQYTSMQPGLYLWRLSPDHRQAYLVRVEPGNPWPLVWYGTRGGYWGRLATTGGVFSRVG